MDRRRARASSAELGSTIIAAWRAGRLGAYDPPSDAATIELLGVGETYAAWHLAVPGGQDLTVRVATRPLGDLPRPMAQEAAALPYVPVGAGPRLVQACLDEGPTNPLGQPYLVTTHQPGVVLPPADWTAPRLRAHAIALAWLHRDRFPGRGAFAAGADPLSALVPGPMSLLAEFDTAMGWWRDHHPQLWHDTMISEVVVAARAACVAAEPAFADLTSYPLVHGDLCVTNVVWDGQMPHDVPHYIDFEWAQTDDPARDLAIIGGPVHAGPWYVPLDEAQVETLLDDYLRETRRLGHDPDRTALRRRRDGWEAYERTAMLLYLTRRAAEGRPGYDDFAAALTDRLAATLHGRR